jgi:hypothetical protein
MLEGVSPSPSVFANSPKPSLSVAHPSRTLRRDGRVAHSPNIRDLEHQHFVLNAPRAAGK